MNSYNEDAQVAAITAWWKEYGVSVVIGLVLALGSFGGWSFWKQHTTEQAQQASDRYYQMIKLYQEIELGNLMKQQQSQAESGETASKPELEFGNLVKDLKTNFSRSEYAHYAALQNAKYLVDQGNLEAAAEELRWLLNNNPSESIKLITNLRLGRLLLAMDQYEAALKIAQMKKLGSYQAAYDELAGDIYVRQGENQKALDAYSAARTASEQVSDELDMKYYNLLEK